VRKGRFEHQTYIRCAYDGRQERRKDSSNEIEWNTARGRARGGEQIAKRDHTTQESIDKSSGGGVPCGRKGGAIGREQYSRGRTERPDEIAGA